MDAESRVERFCERVGDYRADVHRIAAHFGIAPHTLAATLRLAQALQALADARDTATGWLAAARDRQPADQDEP